MPRYSPEQIYGFCRLAGFTPDEAATFTAIALAESGGNSRAHNPHGEDSKGLWQINAPRPPRTGREVRPLRPGAEREGGVRGLPPRRRHLAVDGHPRRHRRALPAVQGRGAGRRDRVRRRAGPRRVDRHARLRAPGRRRRRRTGSAKRHPGARRTGGRPTPRSTSSSTSPRPRSATGTSSAPRSSLDDDEPGGVRLLRTHPVGRAPGRRRRSRTAPPASTGTSRRCGLLIPVEEAKNTPGALLFSFASDRGRRRRASRRSRTWRSALATARRSRRRTRGPAWRTRGRQPVQLRRDHPRHLRRHRHPARPAGAPLPRPPPVAPPPNLGGPDTDHDGLTDALERRLGLDPLRADTDGDNLADGQELSSSGTDPRKATPTATGSATRSSWPTAWTRCRRTPTRTGTSTAAWRRCRPTPTSTAWTTRWSGPSA